MKGNFFQKATAAILSFLFITTTCASYAVESPKDRLNEWIHSYPYIGLVTEEVTYGPIALKKLNLENKGRVVIAKPGETVFGTVHYRVDADKLDTLHLHHIILGIEGKDSQTCLTHALGVWDAQGRVHFSISAPPERGVYELRFDYQTALTCSEASKEWRKEPPSAKATVGIIIVE